MAHCGTIWRHALILPRGNERPCKRCQKRGITCSSESLDQVSLGGLLESSSSLPASSLQLAHPGENTAVIPINVNEGMTDPSGVSSEFQPPEAMYSIAPLVNPVDAWPQLDFDLSFPSFFESIMVPEHDWVGAGEVQMPPDLATVIPDYEEWPGTSDIFGFDFSAAFQQAMEPSPINNEPIDSHPNAIVSSGVVANISTENARQRHDIFKKSPW
jgi:hypothetical protein